MWYKSVNGRNTECDMSVNGRNTECDMSVNACICFLSSLNGEMKVQLVWVAPHLMYLPPLPDVSATALAGNLELAFRFFMQKCVYLKAYDVYGAAFRIISNALNKTV